MVAAETAGAISSTAEENRTPGVSSLGFSTAVDVSASFSVDSGALSFRMSAIAIASKAPRPDDGCARVRVKVGQLEKPACPEERLTGDVLDWRVLARRR
jgi:hypothetical protein